MIPRTARIAAGAVRAPFRTPFRHPDPAREAAA